MALVNASDRADDTHRQLRGTHLHGEHGHRQTFVERHMLGNIDRQRCLAHGWSRRENDQVALLKARGLAVQVMKAGGHAGDVVGVFRHFSDAVQQIDHQRVHAVKALLHARALLADLEDLLLSLVQNHGHGLALRTESLGRDLVTGLDQLAQDGALTHDLRVATNIGRARHVLRQRIEVAQAAYIVGLALSLQVFIDRDHIRRFAGVDQRAHRAINQFVLVAVKILVHQQIAHPVPGAVVQQQAAQHAGLAFNGMRGYAQLGYLPVWAEAGVVKS